MKVYALFPSYEEDAIGVFTSKKKLREVLGNDVRIKEYELDSPSLAKNILESTF